MTLTLFGFTASNYYNKAKLAMLEKGVPFREEFAFPSHEPAFLAASPRSKVPYLRIGEATVCESQAIVEYLEDAYPAVPLYPADPVERAQVRSLIHVMELYVELVARRLYPAAFFGAPLPPGVKDQTAQELKLGIAALKRLARFAPYIGGEEFGLADVAAVWHLPLVETTVRTIYGEDWLADLAGLADYVGLMFQRPHVVAVDAARQAGMEPFKAAVRKRFGLA